jgi:S-methylmethionine-dependent homocysteine/selenocysteine methylase
MVRVDRVVSVLALGACVVGAGFALDLTGAASASPKPARVVTRSANATDEQAMRSLVETASRLTDAIRHARDETAQVLVPSFATLAQAQAAVASERSQLAAEQLQVNGEVAQLAARATLLAAESADLQKEAVALSKHGATTGQPAAQHDN